MSEKQVLDKRIGYNLRLLRTARGMSQRQMAWNLGISNAFMSSLESGRHGLTLIHLIAVSDLFGVSMDELLRSKVQLSAGGTSHE